MRYFDDMLSKSGFDDGENIPIEAEELRAVYIRAVNALAARNGSSCRAVAVDRGGVHNPVLIGFEPRCDAAMRVAIQEADALNLDQYVQVVVTVDPAIDALFPEAAVAGRNGSRQPILSQPKLASENTRRFHARIVRVFARDNQYWIVPTASRSKHDFGFCFWRSGLTQVLSPVLLDLASARLNAAELDDNPSRKVIDQINQRYPNLRLVYAEDVPHYE